MAAATTASSFSTVLYTDPLLYNNGAKITNNLRVPGRATSDSTYTNPDNEPESLIAGLTYTILKRKLDLSPLLERYLNNYSKVKKMRISFNTTMYARGWGKNADTTDDTPTHESSQIQWRDTHVGQVQLNGNGENGGASIDILLKNVVSKQRFKRYTVDVYDSSIFEYEIKLMVTSVKYKNLRAAGGVTIYNLTVDSVQYYQDYQPLQIKLSADKTSFRFNRDESDVVFTYDITDYDENRLVSWKLYADTDPKTELGAGKSTSGTIPIPFASLQGKAPSQSYYIIAQGERESDAYSNTVTIDFEAGDATLAISTVPTYIRYQDYDQEIKVNYRIDNLGGSARQWGLNKTINNNNEVLNVGLLYSGNLNKNYLDKINPLNTIAPMQINDIVDYGLLITNATPLQAVYANVGVYDYNIDKMKIHSFLWKDIETKRVRIPPYTKRKIKQHGSLLDIFGINDDDVNPASKVAEYHFRDWGGRDVKLAETQMNGIMGTQLPKELFIAEQSPDDTTTAQKQISYHFYVTRVDKNWHLTFEDKKKNKQGSLFTINNNSYANNLLTVIYQIDKLQNPKNVSINHISKIIDETTGQVETSKSADFKAFFAGETVSVSWSQKTTTFADIAGFTFEIYDNQKKQVYSKYIDWTETQEAYQSGKGYNYLFKIPSTLKSGTHYFNIVAINEYNNSIKNKRQDGFTWADSESGKTKKFSDMIRMDVFEKREKSQIVAPHANSVKDGMYFFKYPRSPFLVFDAQSYMLDELGDTIPVPIYNEENEIDEIEIKTTDRIWYQIRIGYPQQNIFNYWYPYKQLNWDEFKDKIVSILSYNIKKQLIPREEINSSYYEVKRDANGDLAWDFAIKGCTALWNQYQSKFFSKSLKKKDIIEQVLAFVGIYRDLYTIFTQTDWKSYTEYTWDSLEAIFQNWKSIGGQAHITMWEDVATRTWAEYTKYYWSILNTQNKIGLDRTVTFRFALRDDDQEGIVISGNKGIHSILGKKIQEKNSNLIDLVDHAFYDEIRDNIGIQLFDCLQLCGKQLIDKNPASVLGHLLAGERFPDERFNIQIRSAYGVNDQIYESTWSQPQTITMITTDLHEFAQQPKNRLEESVIYGLRDPNDKNSVVTFGGQTSYILDLMNDIVLYYQGKAKSFGQIVNSGYTFNQLAAAVARGIQFKYNPYPIDLHGAPKIAGERATLINDNEYYKKKLADLNLYEDDTPQKVVYTINEANGSIYNNNLFTNKTVLQFVIKLLQDQ